MVLARADFINASDVCHVSHYAHSSVCHCRVESKKPESTLMKPRTTTVTILAMLSGALALADDFRTTDGKEYKDATVTHVEPNGIVVKTKSGISKLYFTELPKEVQDRFGYGLPQTRYTALQQREYD